MSSSFELLTSRSVARSEITSLSLSSSTLLTTYRSTPALSWVDAFTLPSLNSLSKSSGAAAVLIPEEKGSYTHAKRNEPIRAVTVREGLAQRGVDNSQESTIVIRDVRSGKSLGDIKGACGNPIAVSQDGRLLAARDASSPVRIGIWDIKTGERVALIASHIDLVMHTVFTPQGTLVTASKDGTLRVTNIKTTRTVARLEMDSTNPTLVGVSRDGCEIFSLWGRMQYTWVPDHSSLASSSLSAGRTKEGWPLCFSPDARFLACRTEDGFDIMDVMSKEIVLERNSESMITAAAFDDSVQRFCVGKMDGTIEVWELYELGSCKS
ncbi:quinon protein alcohol dehydrogenase-like superfamily [Emericellopsis atlantica]|uniref:Quinon protein alcohol dehydrogenase-like superfamily n=1 Tax=Emericellopsis atlantica TaxID=2614577 RepID=A0A9P8CRT5_9HYPO|nr:quinon protein alcohol dehydrogenase-like superfamily [Emericellopsis atlantica]KAG9257128.1 quinon protein alcohol dehydrogenase-like superfamily [Emericellopsis atlantica]